MFDVLYIQHSKLTQSLLDEIIKVKTAAWPYSYDEHCEWIKNNLKNSDIHVLLYDGKTALAYINLIEIDVNIDHFELDGFGIGNVCAIEKGKGWGKELIIHVNKYLIENNKFGLLFCKDKLVKFYMEIGWILLDNEQIKLLNKSVGVTSLVYNTHVNFIQLKYDGKLF
jgi:hypothetical protein